MTALIIILFLLSFAVPSAYFSTYLLWNVALNCPDNLLTYINISLLIPIFTEHTCCLAVCNESLIRCCMHLAADWERAIPLP